MSTPGETVGRLVAEAKRAAMGGDQALAAHMAALESYVQGLVGGKHDPQELREARAAVEGLARYLRLVHRALGQVVGEPPTDPRYHPSPAKSRLADGYL